MDIGVEISLYPLDADYVPTIKAFIERLNADARLKVITNSMSTQVFGRYEDVFAALARDVRPAFESGHKAVFVMKVLGPFDPA